MKLLIDISEGDYKFIKDLQSLIIGGRGSCKTIQMNVTNAIRNGIPYETKGDLISREALKKYARIVNDKDLGRLHVVDVSDIDNAPIVEDWKLEHKAYNEGFKDGVDQGIKLSERPQGEWIVDEKGNFYCDQCGKYPHDQYATTNFCPNCGADMREGDKE